jgi:hypothetical protein
VRKIDKRNGSLLSKKNFLAIKNHGNVSLKQTEKIYINNRGRSGLWFKIRKIGRTLLVKKSGISTKIRTL